MSAMKLQHQHQPQRGGGAFKTIEDPYLGHSSSVKVLPHSTSDTFPKSGSSGAPNMMTLTTPASSLHFISQGAPQTLANSASEALVALRQPMKGTAQ
jgi:hypothetical protein